MARQHIRAPQEHQSCQVRGILYMIRRETLTAAPPTRLSKGDSLPPATLVVISSALGGSTPRPGDRTESKGTNPLRMTWPRFSVVLIESVIEAIDPNRILVS